MSFRYYFKKRNVHFSAICSEMAASIFFCARFEAEEEGRLFFGGATADQINCSTAALGQQDLQSVTDGREMQPMRENLSSAFFLQNFFSFHICPFFQYKQKKVLRVNSPTSPLVGATDEVGQPAAGRLQLWQLSRLILVVEQIPRKIISWLRGLSQLMLMFPR